MRANDATVTGWALAARAGDRIAAAAFVRATQQQVHRFLAHLVNSSQAADLTRETYLRAMRHLPGFTAGMPARLWLYAIAGRVATDHPGAAGAGSGTLHVAGAGTGTGDAELPPAAGLLGELSPQQRLAFVATQVLRLSYAEAALVCGCSVEAIRARVAGSRVELVTTLRHRARPTAAPPR